MSKQPGRFRRHWKEFLGGLLALALMGDLALNKVTGGSLDETISSRAGRAVIEGSASVGAYAATALCWALDKIDKNHCEDAANDKGG